MAVNLFTTLAAKFLGGAGASPQQSSTIQRVEVEQKPVTSIDKVNAAVTRETNLNLQQQQLHATVEPESVKAAEAAEAVVVSHDQKISNQELLEMAQKRAAGDPVFGVTLMLSAIRAELHDRGIEVKISPKAVESFKPVLSAFKDLVKSLSPELNLQELVATAKPMLQALSKAMLQALSKAMLQALSKAISSNPAGTPAAAANPA